jgi:hypothetical protein
VPPASIAERECIRIVQLEVRNLSMLLAWQC